MEELVATGNVLTDIRKIIEEGRRQAYAAAGQIAIATYWNIGKRIVEEEQQKQFFLAQHGSEDSTKEN